MELQVGERLETIQAGSREQTADGDLDVAVLLAQRQHLLPQEDARREAREDRPVGIAVFQRGVFQAILAGQPLQNFLLRVRHDGHRLQRVRVQGGKLAVLD